jgi:nucleoside-diphosphate kinase
MSQQVTLFLIKNHALKRELAGTILARLERRFDILHVEMITPNYGKIEKLYEEHKSKDFFERLIDVTADLEMIAVVISGENAIEKARAMQGSTVDPEPGTIRGDFMRRLPFSVSHTSDSPEAAARELEIFWPGRFKTGA